MVTKRVRFTHGLGDCIHFALLGHLYRQHGIEIVVGAEENKRDLFRLCGLEVIDPAATLPYVPWHDPETMRSPTPETWWRFSKVFRNVSVTPLPSIGAPTAELVDQYLGIRLRPATEVGAMVRTEVEAYLAPLKRPIVLLHSTGNTNQSEKSIPKELCPDLYDALVRATGGTVVLLDWDNRVPRGKTGQVRHAADDGFWLTMPRLIALQSFADLMIGVDSGPLHLARLTDVKSIAIWRGHCHPVRFGLPRPNLINLVLGNPEVNGPIEDLFNIVQQPGGNFDNPDVQLIADLAEQAIQTPVQPDEPWPRSRKAHKRWRDKVLLSQAYDRCYYEEHKAGGLDYAAYGEWQREYARWLTAVFGWQGKQVLDVGCACGTLVRGLGEAGALACGVDVSEYMVNVGRSTWPDMAPLLHICDAVNLHLFTSGQFDGLHCMQVAEHWRPELVPFILRELRRVVKPGGLLWCSMDTEELFNRQGRCVTNEDPTHVCIKPLSWWHECLEEAGWKVVSADWRERLLSAPASYLQRYDWDWFVAEARAVPSATVITPSKVAAKPREGVVYSAVSVCRNDNYGGALVERVARCFNTLLTVFDELVYVDWATPSGTETLLEALGDRVPKTGKIKCYVVTPEQAFELSGNDPEAAIVNTSTGRNVGIRRASGDWIAAVTTDVLVPHRPVFEGLFTRPDANTMYTIGRRDIPLADVSGLDLDSLQRFIVSNRDRYPHQPFQTDPRDNWSKICCCGDFQFAQRDLWARIRGYEEWMRYRLHNDSNAQKKVVLSGGETCAIIDIPLMHISHEGGFATQKCRYQDWERDVIQFTEGRNPTSWGRPDTEFDHFVW